MSAQRLIPAPDFPLSEKAARGYRKRIEKLLAKCPGFVGGELPSWHGKQGHVLIELQCVKAALPWLRRRVHVNETMEACGSEEMRIEIVSRRERKKDRDSDQPAKIVFRKPEQFELPLAS